MERLIWFLSIFIIFKALAFSYSRLPATDSPPSIRQYACADYYSDDNSIIIFGGNQGSDINFNDVWEFNLTSNLWKSLTPISTIYPNPRMFHGCWIDNENSMLYIFGGRSNSGPLNDLWRYDLENLQWNQIDQKGEIPSARSAFATTKYKDSKGNLQLITFAGFLKDEYTNELYIYDVSSNYWTKKPAGGLSLPSKLYKSLAQYYEGYIYTFCGEISFNGPTFGVFNEDTFRYNLDSGQWENITNPAHRYESRSYPGNILYDGCAYIIFGYSNVYTDVTSIMRLNLSDTEFKWENIDIAFDESNQDIVPRDAFAFAMANSTFYLFSGYISLYGILDNSLIEFDLKKSPLTYKFLSEAYTNPDARESHSLCVLSGVFYLFGGFDGANYLNDLWVYDPDGESWESINSEGTTPTSRSGHAADSEGNIMVIFGGEGNTGYLGDMYQYNKISNTWTLISPSSNILPNARTGACLKLHMPYIFIFGGLASAGLSSELWVFDVGANEYTLVYDGTGNSPTKSSRPSCDIQIDDYGNINFITMYGIGSGETPLGDVDSFNFTTKKWTKLYTTNGGTPDSNRSKAIVKLIDNSLIVMCGEAWGINVYNEFYILNLDTQNITRIGYLDNYYFYDGAYVYYSKNIYSHGGGTVYGRTMRPMIVTPVFANITLDKSDISPSPYLCSPGTYVSGETCLKCPRGYYADSYGSNNCTPCPLGTFNPLYSASSIRQCYPCDEGSYGDKEGAFYCKRCPEGTICVVGTQAPIYDIIDLNSKSTQPKLYSNADEESQSAIVIMVIVVLLVSLISLTVFILIKPEKLKLRNIDLYSGSHNYKKDSVMKLKKTNCGGIFTILFLVGAIIIILSYCINYQLNNIQETKTLVPLVALEDEATEFPALVNISTTLFNYGGHCKTGDSCHDSISFTTTSISYDSLEMSCYVNNGNNCTISLLCQNCIINTGAYVQLNLLEVSSYTSAIISNVTSFSSIPHKSSGIYQILLPKSGQVFRGYSPNQFYLTMTPSLFRSYVPYWPDKLTGYHVSMNLPASGGSQYTITDLPFSSDLKIQTWLVKNDNSLYTTRAAKQTIFLLLSTMLGSVFGAMSAIGGIMRIVEKSWIHMKNNNQKKADLEKISVNSLEINDQDFMSKYPYPATNATNRMQIFSPTWLGDLLANQGGKSFI